MGENYDTWRERYFNKKIVDVQKEFSKEEKELLEKLGVILEDKIYTEYEFELLDGDVIEYYYEKNMTDEEKAESKELPEGVTRKEYNKLLDKISKINSKYNF